MTQEEFDKAPLLDQILYDTTGMLVENHPSIAEAMEKYHQAKLKLLDIADVISRLKFKLEVNAGRIAEPLLKAGKQPIDDENCHKAFLMLAHLEAIEDYINGL